MGFRYEAYWLLKCRPLPPGLRFDSGGSHLGRLLKDMDARSSSRPSSSADVSDSRKTGSVIEKEALLEASDSKD